MAGAIALHHIQLAMPPGGEEAARGFYRDLLGLPERAKPAALAARGGCWFESDALRLHLGVEADFRAARKAHPALLVDDLDALQLRLTAAGRPVLGDDPVDGMARCFTEDPFGNRIELMQAPGSE